MQPILGSPQKGSLALLNNDYHIDLSKSAYPALLQKLKLPRCGTVAATVEYTSFDAGCFDGGDSSFSSTLGFASVPWTRLADADDSSMRLTIEGPRDWIDGLASMLDGNDDHFQEAFDVSPFWRGPWNTSRLSGECIPVTVVPAKILATVVRKPGYDEAYAVAQRYHPDMTEEEFRLGDSLKLWWDLVTTVVPEVYTRCRLRFSFWHRDLCKPGLEAEWLSRFSRACKAVEFMAEKMPTVR